MLHWATKITKKILQTSAFSWIERLTVPQLDFLSFVGSGSYKTAKSLQGFGELVDKLWNKNKVP